MQASPSCCKLDHPHSLAEGSRESILGEQINDRVPAGCWRCTIARQKKRAPLGTPLFLFPDVLDVPNHGLYMNFTVTAANSQTPTFLLLEEPVR